MTLPDRRSSASAIADPEASATIVRLLWDSPQPLVLQDGSFRIVAANRAFCMLLARPVDQVVGRELHGLAPAEDASATAARQAELLSALRERRQPTLQTERRFVDASGRERWLRSSPRWISADDGTPLLLDVMQEVTLERGAPAETDRRGPQPLAWFEANPIAMLVYDRRGRVVRSNAAFSTLVGSTPRRLTEAAPDLQRLLAWDGNAPHPSLRQDQPALETRCALTLPDGRRQQLRARLRAIVQSGQWHVLAVVEDRSLEDENDLARLEIGALMDTAGIGVATFEASRGWLFNRPSRGSTAVAGGAGVSAALQPIGRDQVEPASQEEFARLQAALRDGERAQVRYAVRLPDLGVRWLLTRVEPGELTGGRRALSVVTLDVTEQEVAHRRNEQLLRELSTLLDGTTAGIAHFRGERLLRCNRRFAAMLGIDDDGAGLALEQAFGAYPEAIALLRRSLFEPGRFEIELAPRGGDDAAWYALSASRAVTDADVEVVAVLTDVTRLKTQQAELESMARERELMASLSEVGIAQVRGERIERANPALVQLTGYPAAMLQGMPLATLFAPGEAEAPAEGRAGAPNDPADSGERRLRRRDGSSVWVHVTQRRIDAAQPAAGLICSYVDIDDRRRVREALQLQADRTRAILDSVLVGIVTVGERGIEWMNRSARRMFGGELADFVGEPIAIVATNDPDHPLRATHYLQALVEGQAETFECRLRGRDGREFWVVGNAVVTGRESTGSQVTFALLDIERRRQAEIRIAQAQASLQQIIETAPLAIVLFDEASARVLRLNQMAATLFGRCADDLRDRPPEAWASPQQAATLRRDFARARQVRPEVLRQEFTSAPAAIGDPSARVWDLRLVSLEAGSESQLLLVGSDVTEQRAAEQARFDAAVAQRELLIKEVHHRIKNNLQGVAGLLQQTAARRPEVAAVIGDAVGQVQAIAQVHGLQVGQRGPLRLEALLRAITGSVQRMFGRPIVFSAEGESTARYGLPESEAIPIALTVNELLTNAIKHGASDSTVECTVHADDAGATVRIRNRGRLREGFSLAQVAPGISGLGLVRALLPRRSATLTLVQTGEWVEAAFALALPGAQRPEPA